MEDAPWGGWRPKNGSGFAFFHLSSLQRTQAVNPGPCITWLEQCLAEGGTRARLCTLPGQAALQKYLLRKSAAPPRGKLGPGTAARSGFADGGWRQAVRGGMRRAAGSPARPPAPLAAKHCLAPPLGITALTPGCRAGTGGRARRRALGIPPVGEKPGTGGRAALAASVGSHGLLEGPQHRAGLPAPPAPAALASLPRRLPLLLGGGRLPRACPP